MLWDMVVHRAKAASLHLPRAGPGREFEEPLSDALGLPRFHARIQVNRHDRCPAGAHFRDHRVVAESAIGGWLPRLRLLHFFFLAFAAGPGRGFALRFTATLPPTL